MARGILGIAEVCRRAEIDQRSEEKKKPGGRESIAGLSI